MDIIAAAGLIPNFINSLKGPDKATQAVTRKNEIYVPLSEALDKYTDESFPLLKDIEIPLLAELAENSYKYGLSDGLLQKCKELYECSIRYNQIDLRMVAVEHLRKSFEAAYEKLFGSCIDGISYDEGEHGEIIKFVIPAQAIDIIHSIQIEDERIIQLLERKGNYTTYIDFDNDVYVDKILMDIFDWALHGIDSHGHDVVLPKPVIPLKYTISEQITLDCHFWEGYNSDQQIKKKKVLHDEIMYQAQAINQQCKEIIEYTVKTFETTKADRL
mgnify:CR=1 FL=1